MTRTRSGPGCARRLMRARLDVDLTDFRKEIRQAQWALGERMEDILEEVGRRVVAYLRSYTGASKEPPRDLSGRKYKRKYGRLHPGGWVDRTYTMRESFHYEVRRESGHWVLQIGNTAPHAHLVEAKHGIFVVRGIEEDGGLIEQRLRDVLREVAPEWDWR